MIDIRVTLFEEILEAHVEYLEGDPGNQNDTTEFAQKVEDILDYYKSHS